MRVGKEWEDTCLPASFFRKTLFITFLQFVLPPKYSRAPWQNEILTPHKETASSGLSIHKVNESQSRIWIQCTNLPVPRTWEEARKETWDKVEGLHWKQGRGMSAWSLAMNHARRQRKAMGQNQRGNQQRQCHSEYLLQVVWSGRGVDEASFKQPETTSQLQVLILTEDFRCPDVCSSRYGGA